MELQLGKQKLNPPNFLSFYGEIFGIIQKLKHFKSRRLPIMKNLKEAS